MAVLVPSDVELVTFDCYGTLVDWERGVIGAFARHVCPDFYVGQLSEVVERWHDIQLELVQGPYQPYREILRRSVELVVVELDLPAPADPGFLAAEMGSFEPFPDTRAALAALARRYPLWILSNIDDDILDDTLRRLDSPIARAITAESLRSYKPAPAHFEAALRLSSVPPDRVLHVAFGLGYDIEPARALGLRTAWINRAGDARPAGALSDLELPDLRALQELLAP